MNLEQLFMDLGYTKTEYEKIVNTYPNNELKHETLYNKVLQNYNFLLSLGYTKPEVIKMTKTCPAIFGYSIENIKQKIEDMILLGYTKEEVIKMTKTIPAIFSYSIENIKQKIEDMISLGYTKEEVIKMTISLPSIYSFSIENIKQKIDFYNSIDMHDLAVIYPQQLIQSVDLSYARYMFYNGIGIEVGMENYIRMFVNNKIFERQYGITKIELLEKYNYKKYIEENKRLSK